MISVGTLGNPTIGYMQDLAFTNSMKQNHVALLEQVGKPEQGFFGPVEKVDQDKLAKLSDTDRKTIEEVQVQAKQGTLAKVAILPAIMFVCYLGLIFYFRSKGGYKAQVLTGHAAQDEKFTGGTAGPGEG
jgi:hypothetical protein